MWWIETLNCKRELFLGRRTLRSAWIEKLNFKGGYILNVAPPAGAWIEIVNYKEKGNSPKEGLGKGPFLVLFFCANGRGY